MTPAELSARILAVVTGVLAGRAGSGTAVALESIDLERPKSREHGDWASNVAMKLAGRIGARPRELAGLRDTDALPTPVVAA